MANQYDTIDQTQLVGRDVSFEGKSFPRSVGLEGGHARLIKAQHRVNKRQVDAVISNHYRRNISSKEDQCGAPPPTTVNFN